MSPKPRKANIFDMLRYLTVEKRPWDKLTDNEKKMSPYLLNKWLSMNPHLLELVNELQTITVGVLSNREVYKLYLDILPHFKIYFKYVKGKDTSKYNKELLDVVSRHLKASKIESNDYLDLIYSSSGYDELLTEFLIMYGYSERDIKKMI